MFINELRKDQLDKISKPFREEVRADFLDCWGDAELDFLLKIVKDGSFNHNPKTRQAILEVAAERGTGEK